MIGTEYDDVGVLVHDPDDPLAPVKAAVKESASEELRPGKVLAAVEAMARSGMDDATRVTVREYLKKEGLLGVAEFDRVMLCAGTPPKRAHTRTPPLTSQNRCAHPMGCARTPPAREAADLLAAAVEAVHDLGVTGETRIIKGTYLTAVSQVLAEPVSLVVKGASAGGKSYSTRTTLRLFPERDFYTVTAGSQRSLIYTDEEFSHRTIVMFEATALREVAEQRDGDMTAMLVRTLLSEGQIIYEVTEKGADGKMATRRITKNGPTNLIVTTTADNLHHENETRLLSLTVDESEEQTRAVMVKIAAAPQPARASGPAGPGGVARAVPLAEAPRRAPGRTSLTPGYLAASGRRVGGPHAPRLRRAARHDRGPRASCTRPAASATSTAASSPRPPTMRRPGTSWPRRSPSAPGGRSRTASAGPWPRSSELGGAAIGRDRGPGRQAPEA